MDIQIAKNVVHQQNLIVDASLRSRINAVSCLLSLTRVLVAVLFFNGSMLPMAYSAEPEVSIQELQTFPVQNPPFPSEPQSEFEFVRIRYDGGYEWPRWRADWPDAEYHFSKGLKRLTRIDVSADSNVLVLNDIKLFEYPWIYIVEVGFWSLSKSERDNLREYLLRGGFLMVDDFHGTREWANFALEMRNLFPDRRIETLEQGAIPFKVHFDIPERQQIPGIRSIMNNRTWEKGGIHPGWFGILDDHGRVMVAINYNQDIGDAWEHADDAIYPEPFTALAYRMGINYVIYAMTH